MKKIINFIYLWCFIILNSAHAIGLGRATIVNETGQPVVIRVPLYNMDIDGYSTLAGYVQGYHESIDQLNYKVARNGNQYFLLLHPLEPIFEPFEMTIVLSYRDKTASRKFLIDLPIEVDRVIKQESDGVRSTPYLEPATPYLVDPSVKSATHSEVYRVKKGDSISMIAHTLARENGLGGSLYQWAIALYRFNIEKFMKKNINALPENTVLVMPPVSDVLAVGRQEAKRIFFKLVAGKRLN